MAFVQDRFDRLLCRESIRCALHRLGLSWKKARKLLGRADPARRMEFIQDRRALRDGAQRDRYQLVYVDEAHLHQDVDLGYGWGVRGTPFHLTSSSPGLSAKVSFYGLCLYNKGQVRIWPYPRASGEHTSNVLRRLRETIPTGRLIVIRDGAPYHRAPYHRAPYHRAGTVQAAAARLNITILPLPGYSPDLMPLKPLWRWLREDVTSQHCHATADDLIRRVAAFEDRVNASPDLVANRLWVKDHLDPTEQKLRFSK